MVAIIVKQYQHFNRALGKYIGSRKEYEQEMAKGGYLPFEKAEQLAEAARTRNRKDYKGLSEKAMKFLGEVRQQADSKGNIKPSQRFIEGLKDNGVKIDCQYDKLPKSYREGGFSA